MIHAHFFASYFKVNNHRKYTRNPGFVVAQPHAKLEFGKSDFYISGASTYNSLPLEIRKNAIPLLILSNL